MAKISEALLEKIQIETPNLRKLTADELDDYYTELHREWDAYIPGDEEDAAEEDGAEYGAAGTENRSTESPAESPADSPRMVVEDVEITARDSTGKIQRYRKMTQEK